MQQVPDEESPCLPHEVDVAILGAGIAGLACAAHLKSMWSSSRILVLEAEESSGGRARTVQVGGYRADAGAGWIHGVEGNPLLVDGILREADLAPCTSGNIWFSGPSSDDSTNFEPSSEESLRWHSRLAEAAKASAEAEREGTPLPSLSALLRGSGDTLSPTEDQFLRGLELWFGATSDLLSPGEWAPGAQIGDFPGPHAVVKEGMPLVAQRLLERAGGEEVLVLNAVVERIQEEEGTVGVQLSVRVAGGRLASLRARWAVCTASLGLLQLQRQGGLPRICPPLPELLLDAVERLRMSPYCKCILALPTDFASLRPTWIWTGHELFPMAFNYFPVLGKPLVTCTSVSQDTAAMDEEVIVEAACAALGVKRVEVLDFFVTCWHSAPWARGSYSFSPLGCDFCEISAFSTLGVRSLILAGEHTHEEHQGSVHGAYLSGKAAAEEIFSRGTS